MGLPEEQIISNLEQSYLLGAYCSSYEKVIINKIKLIDHESATENIFNRKQLLFTCNNYSVTNNIPCLFCMCRQYFVDASINDEKDSNEGAKRSRKNKLLKLIFVH